MKKLFSIFLLSAAAVLVYFYNKSGRHGSAYPRPNGHETVATIQQKFDTIVWNRLAGDLKTSGFENFPENISLLIFKEEQILELYGRQEEKWRLIKIYPFTAFSGKLGPKLKEGDRQIPEGIYRIEYLNPNSSYHLSAKVSYPNDFDRKKATYDNRTQLGGDIFIHGKNKTIGCVPLGDKAIEELFILMSHVLPRKTTVVISPWDFRKKEDFPKMAHIDWAPELYGQIQRALSEYYSS